MSRSVWGIAMAGYMSAACDDGVLRAFEPTAPMLGAAGEVGMGPEPGGGAGGTMSTEPMAGAGAPTAVSALLVDDFEDGDPRAKEPRGWWYPVNDGTGTQGFGIEPIARTDASVYALRAHGSGFETWGAGVGVNLIGDSEPLDALSYEQLCFVARAESGRNTALSVLFARDDDRSYSQAVSLSERWERYCLPLDRFVSQDDRALVANELIALQFFFAPHAPFALWLDDVEIVP